MSAEMPSPDAPRDVGSAQEPSALALNLRSFFRIESADIAALISLAVMVLFFSLAADSFFQIQTISFFLKQSSAPLLLAVGLTFVLLCGEIDLSVGVMATFAACFCGSLYEQTVLGQYGVIPTLLIALAVGFFTGVITAWTRLGSFIITLAMMFVLDGAAVFTTKGQSQSLPPFLVFLATGETRITHDLRIPHVTWISMAAVVIAFIVLRYTRFGRYIYMTGGNREAARLAGVRTNWILIAALTISAFCAAAAGMLHAAKVGQSSAGDNAELLLTAVACVVLGGTSLFGGVGGVIRTVVGVCIWGVLDTGLPLVSWIDEFARKMLLGIVLLAAMILNGLLAQGRFTSWLRKHTRG